MTEEMRKRLEEAAEKYADEYVVGDAAIIVDLIHSVAEECFLAGAEYGYKEAIAQAKEWLKDNANRYIELGSWDGWGDAPFMDKDALLADFKTDMNKLWEEKK